jgi:hypothetical protein
LHGAVRLQGFASSPTPDTHVRVACAESVVPANSIAATRQNFAQCRDLIESLLFLLGAKYTPWVPEKTPILVVCRL